MFTWDRADFGRYVGYLPQDTELFAGSIRDNIARFRTDVTDQDVVAAAKLAGVHELILRLPAGYETEVGDSGHTLSAGQRQRRDGPGARLLPSNPAFIVLDEPNASLDAEGEGALMRALETPSRRPSVTMVIVSHKPSDFPVRRQDAGPPRRARRTLRRRAIKKVMARVAQPATPPANIRAIEATNSE